MADLPILFSAPMVRALLDGRKTQTRRILKPQPLEGETAVPMFLLERARFAKGDRLWVRETFSGDQHESGRPPREWDEHGAVWHWADGNPAEGDWTRPKPGIHMPRWASRLTLTVTDVRVQRLQAITPADCIAEGAFTPTATPMTIDCSTRDPRDEFAALWRSINGPDSWQANPWVVVLSFSVEHRNIDA